MKRRFVRIFAWICTHFFKSVKVGGTENVPAQGRVILWGNHNSFLDVFMLFAHIKRPMRFMAKAELFRIPVVSWVIRKCGAFPVNREESDLSAIRTSLSILKAEGALTIFQTGKRNSNEAKNGAVYLALKAKAPILPFSIDGKFQLFKRTTIRFGQPISFEQYYGEKLNSDMLNHVSGEIWDTICRMVGNHEESHSNC